MNDHRILGLGVPALRGKAGCLRNGERGYTLIELIIATAIAIIGISAVGVVYLTQQAELERQKMLSEADELARMAVNHMSERIRLARAGADPTSALLAACACRISFDSNFRGVYTVLTADSAAATIQVNSVASFAVNDRVSVTDWTSWQTRTINAIDSGTTPPTLTLNTALPSSFKRGSGVFQVLTTTFELDLNPQRLMQGGLRLATNVSMNANGYPPSGNALFRYFDQTNTEIVPAGTGTCLTRCLTPAQCSTIREVSIFLTLESPKVTNQVTQQKLTATQQTGVKLRLPSPS